MDLNQIFSKNIQKYRAEKTLSQEGLAEKSELHRTYISLVERNKRNITLKNIGKIADGLGVEPYLLLMEVDENE